ncbi:MAG: zinc ribbon domain-containing protein [Desulfosalsimonadaceae bacterium]
MPLYEYKCVSCGEVSEILVRGGKNEDVACHRCGGRELEKIFSAHSSMSGSRKNTLPGASDTGCCGTSPAEATCAGPGSCCGKTGW